LAARIVAEQPLKRDFVANSKMLDVRPDGKVVFNVGESVIEAKPTGHFLGQMAEFADIPRKYFDRMLSDAPELFAQNVNTWMQRKAQPRLIRTIVNGSVTARAMLSDKFRALDNHDLAEAVLPALQKAGCVVKTSQITEQRLYIQAVSNNLVARIPRVADGHTIIKLDDEVYSGLIISNSEVGAGSLRIEHLVYTSYCTNLAIFGDVVRKAHVGRRGFGNGDGISDESAMQFFTNETRQLDDKAFWMKVSDVVGGVLSEETFGKAVAKMTAASEIHLPEFPTAIVDVTQKTLSLSDPEKESVLTHLAKGGDFSLYGLHNAVTRTAADSTNYDRAVELERLGGGVLELGSAFTREIALAAKVPSN
jgi:hypothetical protein